METVLEDFEAHMGLAVGDFAIITKNVMYLACGRPVTFRPLFCLGMRRGKMVVLNRLRRPRNDHGLVGLTFWSRRRYVRSVFLEEQNSPCNKSCSFCVVLSPANISRTVENFGENIAFMKLSDVQKTCNVWVHVFRRVCQSRG